MKLACILGTSKPTALLDGVTAPSSGFGIRSYLHQFYQSPAVEDIESAGAWYISYINSYHHSINLIIFIKLPIHNAINYCRTIINSNIFIKIKNW